MRKPYSTFVFFLRAPHLKFLFFLKLSSLFFPSFLLLFFPPPRSGFVVFIVSRISRNEPLQELTFAWIKYYCLKTGYRSSDSLDRFRRVNRSEKHQRRRRFIIIIITRVIERQALSFVTKLMRSFGISSGLPSTFCRHVFSSLSLSLFRSKASNNYSPTPFYILPPYFRFAQCGVCLTSLKFCTLISFCRKK